MSGLLADCWPMAGYDLNGYESIDDIQVQPELDLTRKAQFLSA